MKENGYYSIVEHTWRIKKRYAMRIQVSNNKYIQNGIEIPIFIFYQLI